jgi:hypothetical protein
VRKRLAGKNKLDFRDYATHNLAGNAMRNEDWKEVFRLIPEDQHSELVIMLQNGIELVVDVLFRFEPNFLVLRGRQAGQVDEGRAFFVPYDQMLCLRLERRVKLQELYGLYGEEPPADAIEDVLGEEPHPSEPTVEKRAQSTRLAAASPMTMVAGAAAPAADSNAQARNNLLERIRAARATSTPRNGNGPQPTQPS